MKELSDFLAAPFRIELVSCDGVCYGFIPDLELSARKATVDDVLAELEARKAEYFETQRALGRIDRLSGPVDDGRFGSLMPFFIKSVTVTSLIAFIVVVGIVSVSYAFREPLQKVVARSMHSGLAEFTAAIDGARGEKRMTELHDAVEKLKPYARELRPLYLELTGGAGDSQ